MVEEATDAARRKAEEVGLDLSEDAAHRGGQVSAEDAKKRAKTERP